MQQNFRRCLTLTVGVLALSCVSLVFSPKTVYAQKQEQKTVKLIFSKNPQDVFTAAKNAYLSLNVKTGKIEGTDTKLLKDSDGDPWIRSHMNHQVIGLASPVEYDIYFFNCSEGKDCNSIAFSIYWDGVSGITEQKINAWEMPDPDVKAFLGENGRVILQKRLDLSKGIPEEILSEEFMWWQISAEAFMDEFIAKK